MPVLVGCPDNAFFTLKPKNAAALLAFTEVVDHILQEQQHSDLQERVARTAQFLWLDSNEKVESKPVAQLMSRRLNTMPGSSSPLSSIDGETGMFVWTGGYFFDLEKSSSAGWTLGRLGLPSASNTLDIGGLQFEFTYTNFSQTEQAKVILRDYLARVYGADSQAPSETISATPTPGSTTSTLGQYTLYGALGAGSYGSVRPAVSRSGDEIFAIKTIISRRNLASESIPTMRRITKLLDSSPGKGNVLRLIESFEIPGAMDEIHLVLSPFTPITLEKLPVQTQ
ncbi:unnamed protein product [Clonostachys solani]|uniref:Protein kinase domain-containing protein n=1 Tax=Clonostachys solani TaxID=160281 RepID=A0A9N9W7A5_9HYPO|nr:unnamed protein product [Clonostachys solani]